jgi:Uncharacterized protein conserved in bacteria (DUF2188)
MLVHAFDPGSRNPAPARRLACDARHALLKFWPDPCSEACVSHPQGTSVEKDSESRVVTVRPGEHQDWRVAIEGGSGDLRFTTRQLAIDFARAYAKLRRTDTIQVYNATGVVENEEKVDLSLAGTA